MPPKLSTRAARLLSRPGAAPSSSTLPPPPPRTPTPASPASRTPSASTPRVFPERKTFLWNSYSHLIRTSKLILVFEHANMTSSEWARMRRAIAAVPLPLKQFDATSPRSRGKAAAAQVNPIEPATISVMRTGIFAAVLGQKSPLRPYVAGQRAVLSCASLSPTYLAQLSSVIARTVRQIKRENSEIQPALTLVGGMIEGGKVMDVPELEALGKLPELDVLRAQVVGMLEGQARSLVGVLAQAGGGGLVRTLQGLEQDLKEKAGGAEASA
ncbi:hypothetical protein IAT38_000641 [Cryptococcus sp. DSM 104549]